MSQTATKQVSEDIEDAIPLLREELTLLERAQLQQIVMLPGFKVLIKIANAACTRFNNRVVKLDPEASDFDEKVGKRQLKAWVASKICTMIFKAVDWHTEQVAATEKENEEVVVDSVAKLYGIHTIGPKKALLKQPRPKATEPEAK